MAKLNLEYYSGKDIYSDGEVEDLIYTIVKDKKDYRELELKDQNYAVAYHLSYARENIFNWYPFEKECSVMEIGSGCGAITGLLCKRCKSVVAVELSKKRSEINYLRNEEYNNLEIITGNVSDIKTDKKFDYIILNGVFEYAISFIRSPHPYHDFLMLLSQFLNPTGKILLAIENRLGIKYFAGEMEDHTDRFFLGLNDYKNENHVRTFSRSELSNIIKKCGFDKYKFYYPYPDYKFPVEIFCDESINDREYGKRIIKHSKKRVRIFDEIEMMHTLRSEKIMQHFANSFLVEMGSQNCTLSSILYAKINSERKDQFKIATIIQAGHDKQFVEKKAMTELAVNHIRKMMENQSSVLPRKFSYLKGVLKEDSVIFPYINDHSVDSIIETLLLEENYWEVKRILHTMYDLLMELAEEKRDIYCNKFIEMFGSERSDRSFMCIDGCNIDLICDNIYWVKGEYVVIDVEWVTESWIPVDFIIWRVLNELFVKHEPLFKDISKKDYYKEFGIDRETDILFRKWANHFADIYVSDDSDHKDLPVPQEIDLNIAIDKEMKKNELQSSIYIDCGEGFSEDNKIVGLMKIADNTFWVSFNLNGIEKIQQIRWDPLEGMCCRCSVDECILSGRKVKTEPCNAVPGNKELFMNVDPQFQIYGVKDSEDELLIKGKLEILKMDEVTCYFEQIRENIDLLKKENIILKEMEITLENEI